MATKYKRGDRVALLGPENRPGWFGQPPRMGTIYREPKPDDSGLKLYRVKVDNTRPGYSIQTRAEHELSPAEIWNDLKQITTP